jgi:hypothetical protein
MSPRKRSFLDSIADEEPNLRIITHDCEEGLPAHRDVLRLVSSCAKAAGLPRAADPATPCTWDLRGVRVDGEPVSRTLVLSWLELVYAHHDFCAGPQLRDATGVISLNAVKPLLLLADALGTSSAVLRGALKVGCRHSVTVDVGAEGAEQPVTIPLDDGAELCVEDLDLLLWHQSLGKACLLHTFADQAQVTAFLGKLEEWRSTCLGLGLTALASKLRAFARTAAQRAEPSVIDSIAELYSTMFSDRSGRGTGFVCVLLSMLQHWAP